MRSTSGWDLQIRYVDPLLREITLTTSVMRKKIPQVPKDFCSVSSHELC